MYEDTDVSTIFFNEFQYSMKFQLLKHEIPSTDINGASHTT